MAFVARPKGGLRPHGQLTTTASLVLSLGLEKSLQQAATTREWGGVGKTRIDGLGVTLGQLLKTVIQIARPAGGLGPHQA